MSNRPLLIAISSNRNYGWVVPAFLKANTHWADYIVITDQMSTDGSREMYAQYNNVIVVDDNDMQFKENTRARMAFEKGRDLAAGEMRYTLHWILMKYYPQIGWKQEMGRRFLILSQEICLG